MSVKYVIDYIGVDRNQKCDKNMDLKSELFISESLLAIFGDYKDKIVKETMEIIENGGNYDMVNHFGITVDKWPQNKFYYLVSQENEEIVFLQEEKNEK